MKNILKTTIFAILLISFGSCSDSFDPIVSSNGIVLHAETPNGPYILSPEAGDNDVTTLTWDASDNGVKTASPTYDVEIAKSGTNFASPIVASPKSTSLTFLWKEGYLNAILLDNGFLPYVATDIDVRVKSTLGAGSNPFIQYSNIITVKITPFAVPMLAFTKESQDPATAPKILASGSFNQDYEGYMWLEPGDYKFFTSVLGVFQSSNPFYGDGGSGSLILNGSNYNVTKAGYYLVTADLTSLNLKFAVKFIRAFGIFGTAKSGPSALAIPMEYNADTNLWKLTFELFKGRRFKFKSNDWVGNLVGNPPAVPPGATTTTPSILGSTLNSGELSPLAAAGDIIVPGTNDGTKQKYDIVLDVSKPRNYTYTLTLNPN